MVGTSAIRMLKIYPAGLNKNTIFYFLFHIAHMLAQLLEKGDPLKKAFPAGCSKPGEMLV